MIPKRKTTRDFPVIYTEVHDLEACGCGTCAELMAPCFFEWSGNVLDEAKPLTDKAPAVRPIPRAFELKSRQQGRSWLRKLWARDAKR